MSEALPQLFTWDAGRSVMAPVRRSIADKTYVDRETYRLGVIEERSQNSHSHYFATLAEAWGNLPDWDVERFPTVEHLRKYALIKSGYADERSICCTSAAEAQRIAAFIKPMDGYALVSVSGPVVRVFTAKSQSKKAMGAKDFQDSKQKVLELVADMIGVTAESLGTNAALNSTGVLMR